MSSSTDFNGTQRADIITIAPDGTLVRITGLPAGDVEVSNAASLTINGLGGDDIITAQNGFPPGYALTIDGGSGNDKITGSDQADTLLGGSGNDVVSGGRGNDVAFLGSGNDTFIWNPGDGSDTVDGGAGNDTLQFNGSNAAEDITLSANGSHVTLFRNVAAVTLDLNGIETLNIATLGSTDHVTVNDLSGTDVRQVNVDLGGFGGAPDGQADTVSVVGTSADDTITLLNTGTETVVKGLAAQTHVLNAESLDTVNVQGGAGSDVFDLSKLTGAVPTLALDGGDGIDTALIKGSSAGEEIDLVSTGGGGLAIERNGAFAGNITLTNVENLLVQGQGGDDVLRAQNGFPGGLTLTLDGGAGNDTLVGSDQADILLGGSGNDVVSGGRGNDVASLGSGNDTFIWSPGDGSDTVNGDGGQDTLRFNGSNAGEMITLSSSGSGATLFRNIANVTMNLTSVETVDIATLGSTDQVTINDVSGSGVSHVNVDLGATGGGGDGAVDTVTVVGTGTDDTVKLASSSTETVVTGLSADVHVTNSESTDVVNVSAGAGNDVFDLSNLAAAGPTLALDGGDGTDRAVIKGSAAGDNLSLQGLGGGALAFSRDGVFLDTLTMTNVENLLVQGQSGDDTITVGNGFPAGVALTIDGGGGNDTITGGDQADTLIGGSGDDIVRGGRGNDVASLGSGNDTFIWNPGDGSDTVAGGAGMDTLQFNGSNAGEDITLSANGSHATLFRNVAAVTMDLSGIETVNIAAAGSTDNITVGDLTGTDVRQVNVDLGLIGSGTGDAAVDLVSVNGTDHNDVVKLATNGSAIGVTGLHVGVSVDHGETIDTLAIHGGAGNDRLDASGVSAGGPTLILDGGAGNDVLIGGAGHDIFLNGETIVGFDANQDQLDLRALAGGQTSDWVFAHAQDAHGNVILDFGSSQITLVGESVAQLHANDFILS